MFFTPSQCPNCRLKWQDRAHPGICDLCGFSLAEGKQTARFHGPSRGTIGPQPARRAPAPIPRVEVRPVPKVKDDPARGAYRPLLPGVLVRDPDDLLSTIDPTVLADLANRMTSVLGRQGEGTVRGTLPAKRAGKVAAVLHTIHAAVPGRRAELIVDSEPLELPVRITAVPAGKASALPGRRVSETPGETAADRLRTLVRVLLVLGALGYFLLMKYLEFKRR